MTELPVLTEFAVDALFPLDGQTLPQDHAQALQQALCAQFPWLQTDAIAAVHPIKLVAGNGDQGLVPRRARLILRVGSHRMAELMALKNIELDVLGCPVILAPPHPRELQPHATLYSYKVASSGVGEAAFMEAVEHELASLSIGGERVCGKRGQMQVSGQVLDTFSLMLHALKPDQSLRLQQHGIGPHRLLGCGVFVPHKSAAAV